jgi:hypothetical protein
MKGLRSVAGLAEAPALDELQLIRSVALSDADVELLASHPTLRQFDWFWEDVPQRVALPVLQRMQHFARAKTLYPEQWFEARQIS